MLGVGSICYPHGVPITWHRVRPEKNNKDYAPKPRHTQWSSPRETEFVLDTYCAIITHALRCIENVLVPIRRMRLGCEFSNWTRNFNLITASIHVRSPMQIACGHPRKGIINAIRLESKCNLWNICQNTNLILLIIIFNFSYTTHSKCRSISRRERVKNFENSLLYWKLSLSAQNFTPHHLAL